ALGHRPHPELLHQGDQLPPGIKGQHRHRRRAVHQLAVEQRAPVAVEAAVAQPQSAQFVEAVPGQFRLDDVEVALAVEIAAQVPLPITHSKRRSVYQLTSRAWRSTWSATSSTSANSAIRTSTPLSAWRKMARLGLS